MSSSDYTVVDLTAWRIGVDASVAAHWELSTAGLWKS